MLAIVSMTGRKIALEKPPVASRPPVEEAACVLLRRGSAWLQLIDFYDDKDEQLCDKHCMIYKCLDLH
jgi:hypothetical protein